LAGKDRQVGVCSPTCFLFQEDNVNDFEKWFEENGPTHEDVGENDAMWLLIKATAAKAWKAARGEVKPPEPKERKWSMELLYKTNYQYTSKVMHLGDHVCVDKKEAEELAKQKATIWLEEVFKKNEIEKWEVRARPARF
jgi:hypothetical protein